MSYLKEIKGVPSRDQIVPGMAYYTGSGPKGTVCGNCDHFGDAARGRKQHCRMYISMMGGKLGPRIEPDQRSCKYYEKTKA